MAHAATYQSAPRASTAPAQAPARGFFSRVWDALVVVGQRRAANELEQLARNVEGGRPELARQLRASARHALNG